VDKIAGLVKSRTHLLYAKILETIEKDMPDVTKRKAWPDVRSKILNLGNSVVRGNERDFEEFFSQYKSYPLILTCDASGKKKISFSGDALDAIQANVTFGEEPVQFVLKAQFTDYNMAVFRQLAEIMGVGKVMGHDNTVYYGAEKQDCVTIIKVLDLFPFREDLYKRYKKWRQHVLNWNFKCGDL